MAVCYTCKADKPETDFGWQEKSTKRHGQCKLCKSAYNHARYLRYRDKIRASSKEHYEANKAAVKVRAKRYYEGNKDAIKVKAKLYYSLVTFPDVKSYLRRILSKKRHRSKKGGPETTVTLEYLVNLWNKQEGVCVLSGRKMIWKVQPDSNTTVHSPDVISVDRIDQSRGYVPGNVRLVCWRVNTFRGHFSDAELIEFCRDVVRTADKALPAYEPMQ